MPKMKIFISALAALTLACAPCAGAGTAETSPIVEIDYIEDAALSKLLIAAGEENPQIAAARQRTEAARAKVEAAAARLGPDVFAGLGGLWQDDGVTVNASVPFLGSLPVTAIGSHTYAAAVGLSQVIYAGGSLTAQKEAERLALGAAQAQELRTEQAVENSVRRAYYALRAAQAKARVAREALSLAKEHLTRAEKLFKAGVVAKNDVLRGGVAVSEAELSLIRAQSGEANALTALRRAVGTELIKAELEAPDIFAQKLFSEGGDRELAKILPRVPGGDRTAQAFEARAELKAYALLSKQAEKLARAAQGRTLPQILGAAGYVAADDSFFPGEGEAVAAIGMYWNLYDGGEMRAKTREAKAKAKELLFQLEDMKNAVRMEVVQAEQNLTSARSRLEVALRQTEQAREDYRIAVRRYEENVGTALEESDSRVALVNALSETATALYDIKTAEADLIYAVGK
ncbi:MAG TPA: TolC family protein [Candidatus Caccocola faecipullorum]|nr:TolC family protein [Candidatus Caccocola faecipullorum]